MSRVTVIFTGRQFFKFPALFATELDVASHCQQRGFVPYALVRVVGAGEQQQWAALLDAATCIQGNCVATTDCFCDENFYSPDGEAHAIEAIPTTFDTEQHDLKSHLETYGIVVDVHPCGFFTFGSVNENLAKQNKKLQGVCDDLLQRQKQQKSDLQKFFKSQQNQMNEAHRANMETVKTTTAASTMASTMASARKEHEAEMAGARREHAVRMKRVASAHGAKVAGMKAAHASGMDSLRRSCREAVQRAAINIAHVCTKHMVRRRLSARFTVWKKLTQCRLATKVKWSALVRLVVLKDKHTRRENARNQEQHTPPVAAAVESDASTVVYSPRASPTSFVPEKSTHKANQGGNKKKGKKKKKKKKGKKKAISLDDFDAAIAEDAQNNKEDDAMRRRIKNLNKQVRAMTEARLHVVKSLGGDLAQTSSQVQAINKYMNEAFGSATKHVLGLADDHEWSLRDVPTVLQHLTSTVQGLKLKTRTLANMRRKLSAKLKQNTAPLYLYDIGEVSLEDLDHQSWSTEYQTRVAHSMLCGGDDGAFLHSVLRKYEVSPHDALIVARKVVVHMIAKRKLDKSSGKAVHESIGAFREEVQTRMMNRPEICHREKVFCALKEQLVGSIHGPAGVSAPISDPAMVRECLKSADPAGVRACLQRFFTEHIRPHTGVVTASADYKLMLFAKEYGKRLPDMLRVYTDKFPYNLRGMRRVFREFGTKNMKIILKGCLRDVEERYLDDLFVESKFEIMFGQSVMRPADTMQAINEFFDNVIGDPSEEDRAQETLFRTLCKTQLNDDRRHRVNFVAGDVWQSVREIYFNPMLYASRDYACVEDFLICGGLMCRRLMKQLNTASRTVLAVCGAKKNANSEANLRALKTEAELRAAFVCMFGTELDMSNLVLIGQLMWIIHKTDDASIGFERFTRELRKHSRSSIWNAPMHSIETKGGTFVATQGGKYAEVDVQKDK